MVNFTSKLCSIVAVAVALSGSASGTPAARKAASLDVARPISRPNAHVNNVVAHKKATKINKEVGSNTNAQTGEEEKARDAKLNRRSILHTEEGLLGRVSDIVAKVHAVESDQEDIPEVFDDLHSIVKGPHPKKNNNPSFARKYGHEKAKNKLGKRHEHQNPDGISFEKVDTPDWLMNSLTVRYHS